MVRRVRSDMGEAGRISAVIPTLDEEDRIGAAVATLRGEVGEVIVVDGGSRDATVSRAGAAGARVRVAPGASRAVALNIGAALATGEIVYFVHADCRPPRGFSGDIVHALAAGAGAGCFRLRFDSGHWLLRLSGWCTRADFALVRYGDQSLFVTRRLLRDMRGYDERLTVMEDQDLVRRLRRRCRFVVVARPVVASARRYRSHGVFRMQLVVYPVVVALYRLHAPPQIVARVYRRLLAARSPHLHHSAGQAADAGRTMAGWSGRSSSPLRSTSGSGSWARMTRRRLSPRSTR
jgi:rSAM/selenodomain-associated transferase 2